MKLINKIKLLLSFKKEQSLTGRLDSLYGKNLKNSTLYRLNLSSTTIENNTNGAFQLNSPSSIWEFKHIRVNNVNTKSTAVARLAIPYFIAVRASENYDLNFIEHVKGCLITQLAANVPKSANVLSDVTFVRPGGNYFQEMQDLAAVEIRAFVNFTEGNNEK